jgi:hypothetical protein
MFGNVHVFEVPDNFDIRILSEYCTLENVKVMEGCIYARVSSLEKPYSKMLKDIHLIVAH